MAQTTSQRSIALALIVAGIVGAAVGLAGMEASLRLSANPTPPFVLLGVLMVLVVTNVAITCTLGLAWHAIATRNNWRSWPAYVIAGACGGALVALPLDLLTTQQIEAEGYPGYISAAAIGAITALVLWWLRRPDRDTSRAAHAVFE